MAITKNTGRQYPLTAVVPFTFEDMGADGVFPAIDLPADAEVVSGEIVVDTAWNSTTNTVDVGDGDNDDRYTASPVDLKATGRTALDLTGFKYSTPDTIDLTYAVTGTAPTQGAARLLVQYVLHNGRANEVQPDSAD